MAMHAQAFALDFVGTLIGRRDHAPVEMLPTSLHLAAWLRDSEIVDDKVFCSDRDLANARAVREAIYLLVAEQLHGEPSHDTEATALVNATARAACVVPQLDATGRRLLGSASQALSSIARNAIEILGGIDADFLKECARAGCTQVFLDHSRSSRRERCATLVCGSRGKARASRSLQQLVVL
ncbi:CGNR zinc finger domain-containing protein [Kribbella sp. NPDC051587]|uniref:CGNR zinc finger domain-containing protein n=1 Tax=Kribbella sp. NPDC051587 TaxID=3364119 RepID=UPI0037A375A7